MSVASDRPSMLDSEYDPADDTWDDWSDDGEPMTCLFCSTVYHSVSELFSHCVSEHNFDFIKLRKEHRWDFYQCVRTINYVRRRVILAQESGEATDFSLEQADIDVYMNDDAYLAPTLEEDSLLYAFENLDTNDAVSFRSGMTSGSRRGYGLSEVNILDRLRAAESKLLVQDREMQAVRRQFEEYRMAVKTQFYDSLEEPSSNVSRQVIVEDTGYFNSYAHVDIHDQMLKDRVRTEAYRDFIYDNKSAFKDKIVLDVGCGTGILSMFAARAGAARVFAVDNSNIIEQAKRIAAENKLDDKIEFIRGKIEDITLPVLAVDVIISEWMGYFLLFESMLDSVLVARDRFLAPDGILGPSHSSIHWMGIEDEEFMHDKITCWNDVYGFKMTTIQQTMYNDAIVDTLPAHSRITDTVCLQGFDHAALTVDMLDFEAPFSIQATRDAVLHAFLGYFDILFDLPEDMPSRQPVTFTTGPHNTETHWKQTIFLLKEQFAVQQGDWIVGKLTCRKNRDNARELDIKLVYWKASSQDSAAPENPHQQTYRLC